MIKLTGNPKIDSAIGEYFGMIGNKVGFKPLTAEEIQQKLNPQAPQAVPKDFDLPSNINLSNYVD